MCVHKYSRHQYFVESPFVASFLRYVSTSLASLATGIITDTHFSRQNLGCVGEQQSSGHATYFNWIEVWALTRLFQDISMFLFKPLFSFSSISHCPAGK